MSELPPGTKLDSGKPDWTLMPWDALLPVVFVLMFGEKKYSRDGWRQVPNAKQRYTAALVRHVIAFAGGEWQDPETHEPHLAHAICCALFILSLAPDETV